MVSASTTTVLARTGSPASSGRAAPGWSARAQRREGRVFASVAVAAATVLVSGMLLWACCLVGAAPAYGGASGSDGPGGSVTVGAGSGSGSGGAPGGPGTSGGPGGAGSGGSSSPWACTYTALTLNDNSLPPGGPTPGAWYSVTCVDHTTGVQTTQTEWIPDQAAAGAPQVDPYSLALQAEHSMELPRPLIATDPGGASVVNLATWLWIDPSSWHGYQVTASAGPVSATASALPVSVTWSMGDGDSVTCLGPGTPYDPQLADSLQSTDCSYRYAVSSAGQPAVDGNPNDGAFTVTATIAWSVSWSAHGAPGGGTLPSLSTSAAVPLRVQQVESVNTALERPTDGAFPRAHRLFA